MKSRKKYQKSRQYSLAFRKIQNYHATLIYAEKLVCVKQLQQLLHPNYL